MRIVAAVVTCFVLGLFLGLWYGSRERTCAVVNSTQGTVILCSNSWKSRVEQ
jgi:hypothetical protein